MVFLAAGDVVKVGREGVVPKKKQDLYVGVLKWRVRKKRTMSGPRMALSCYGMVQIAREQANASEDPNRPPAIEGPAALGSSLCGFQTSKDVVKDGRHHERMKVPKQTKQSSHGSRRFRHSGNVDAIQAGPPKYCERYGLTKNQPGLTRYPERFPTPRPLTEELLNRPDRSVTVPCHTYNMSLGTSSPCTVHFSIAG